MNQKLASALEGKTLPVFALFKNLVFESAWDLPFTEIVDFDEIFIGQNIDDPILRPPKMEVSQEFLDELEEKYGNTFEEYYTTFPANLVDEFPDKEIFGTSYTVLCIFPPDVDFTVDYIVDWADKNRNNSGEIDLYTIWNFYLEHLYFFPQFDDIVGWDFAEKIEEKLNKLPNPPTKSDWDYLEESLWK
ncbi:MAG: hypothetical protein V4642_11660 [Bacteroidota bacterium]